MSRPASATMAFVAGVAGPVEDGCGPPRRRRQRLGRGQACFEQRAARSAASARMRALNSNDAQSHWKRAVGSSGEVDRQGLRIRFAESAQQSLDDSMRSGCGHAFLDRRCLIRWYACRSASRYAERRHRRRNGRRYGHHRMERVQLATGVPPLPSGDRGADEAAAARIAVAGRNCWRVVRAHRLAFLIERASLLSLLQGGCARARHSILIVGWDVNSRTKLEFPDDARPDVPNELGPFLNFLVCRRQGLEIRVLNWDSPLILPRSRVGSARVRLVRASEVVLRAG